MKDKYFWEQSWYGLLVDYCSIFLMGVVLWGILTLAVMIRQNWTCQPCPDCQAQATDVSDANQEGG